MSCGNRKKYVILGAGISGLSLAFYLKMLAKVPTEITVLESSSRIGGHIRTDSMCGYLFERGPHTLRLQGETGKINRELFDLLGLSSQIIFPAKAFKNKCLLRAKKVIPLFPGPQNFLSSSYLRKVVLPILQEPFRSKDHPPDESIYDFFSRRFGYRIAMEYISPMVSGIFGGDIRDLSVRSCFPAIQSMARNPGSLFLKLLQEKRSNPSLVISFAKGLEMLPKCLASRLSENILLNQSDISVQWTEKPVVFSGGRRLDCDALFSTVPGHQLTRLRNPSDLSDFFSPEFISFVAVNLGFPESIPIPEAFGYLTGEKEKIVGMIFDSRVFPQQNGTPSQTRLTVMFKAARGEPFFPEEYYRKEALKACREHLNIFSLPDHLSICLHDQAIPQFRVGHEERVARMQKEIRKRHPNFFITGSSYGKIPIAECIRLSYLTAKRFTEEGCYTGC